MCNNKIWEWNRCRFTQRENSSFARRMVKFSTEHTEQFELMVNAVGERTLCVKGTLNPDVVFAMKE